MLEAAVAVAQARARRPSSTASVPSAPRTPAASQDGSHVGFVGAGVGPHGPADRARDGQPELEAGQAGRPGQRRRPGHRQRPRRRPGVSRRRGSPRPGRLDHQAADAGVAMTRSLPRPRSVWARPRARAKRTTPRSSKRVVDLGEQVGRAAHAHRREARQRLLARRLDADPALDVRPQAGRVGGVQVAIGGGRGHDHLRRRVGRSRSTSAASGTGRCWASGEEDGRVRRRGARPAQGPAGRRASPPRAGRRPGCASAATRASASNASSSTSSAAPASATKRALARWWPAAWGYGTTTIGRPSGGDLGQGRGAGPADDEVGGHERLAHLVAQEGVRPVAVAHGRPAAPRAAAAPRRRPPRRSRGRRGPVRRAAGRASATAALKRAHGLRAAEDQEQRLAVGGTPNRCAGGDPVDPGQRRGSGVPVT